MPHATDKSDLRSSAKARDRETTHHAKWNPKWNYHGDRWDARNYKLDGSPRPQPAPRTHRFSKLQSRDNEKAVRKDHARGKLPKLGEELGVTDVPTGLDASEVNRLARCETPGFRDQIDSFNSESGNDGSMSASTRLAIDQGGHGMGVLSTAVDQAVERYEDKKTTQLVRDEYECVDSEEEAENSSGTSGKGSMDEDDGFELI